MRVVDIRPVINAALSRMIHTINTGPGLHSYFESPGVFYIEVNRSPSEDGEDGEDATDVAYIGEYPWIEVEPEPRVVRHTGPGPSENTVDFTGDAWVSIASPPTIGSDQMGHLTTADDLTVAYTHANAQSATQTVTIQGGGDITGSGTITFDAKGHRAGGDSTIELSFTETSGGEGKVKVTSNDTTADYLLNKLAAGDGIAITEVNDAGDEDARIALKFCTSPSNGDLFKWNTASTCLTPVTPEDVEVVTDYRVDAATFKLQKKTRTVTVIAATSESAWTDVHTGEECDDS